MTRTPWAAAPSFAAPYPDNSLLMLGIPYPRKHLMYQATTPGTGCCVKDCRLTSVALIRCYTIFMYLLWYWCCDHSRPCRGLSFSSFSREQSDPWYSYSACIVFTSKTYTPQYRPCDYYESLKRVYLAGDSHLRPVGSGLITQCVDLSLRALLTVIVRGPPMLQYRRRGEFGLPLCIHTIVLTPQSIPNTLRMLISPILQVWGQLYAPCYWAHAVTAVSAPRRDTSTSCLLSMLVSTPPDSDNARFPTKVPCVDTPCGARPSSFSRCIAFQYYICLIICRGRYDTRLLEITYCLIFLENLCRPLVRSCTGYTSSWDDETRLNELYYSKIQTYIVDRSTSLTTRVLSDAFLVYYAGTWLSEACTLCTAVYIKLYAYFCLNFVACSYEIMKDYESVRYTLVFFDMHCLCLCLYLQPFYLFYSTHGCVGGPSLFCTAQRVFPCHVPTLGALCTDQACRIASAHRTSSPQLVNVLSCDTVASHTPSRDCESYAAQPNFAPPTPHAA